MYPPVDTDFFRPDSPGAERSALVVSALVPYKRIEIAIRACALMRLPLTIVGDGPDRARLERLGGTGVTFTGRVSDEDVRALYQRSAVVLLPGEEDFGIAPLEAQACGRPVVALGRGGATETVVDGATGVLVDETTPQAFANGIARALATTFDVDEIRAHAERFGRTRFADEMESLIRGMASEHMAVEAPAQANGA